VVAKNKFRTKITATAILHDEIFIDTP